MRSIGPARPGDCFVYIQLAQLLCEERSLTTNPGDMAPLLIAARQHRRLVLVHHPRHPLLARAVVACRRLCALLINREVALFSAAVCRDACGLRLRCSMARA